jgi:glutathione-regulated potassium-efflux system ancillary protein KefG
MKKWLDDVLVFRWAYGPGGEALRGKQLLIAISTGGPADSYLPGGYHNYTTDELLVPFRQIANLVGASYLRPYVFHRARTVTDGEITASATDYVRQVLRPDLEVLPVRAGNSGHS